MEGSYIRAQNPEGSDPGLGTILEPEVLIKALSSRPFSLCGKWQWHFLAVQWFGLQAFTAKGTVSVPGQGTKILQTKAQPKKKTQTKKDLFPSSSSYSSVTGNELLTHSYIQGNCFLFKKHYHVLGY